MAITIEDVGQQYEGESGWNCSAGNDVQILLRADGTIEIHYGDAWNLTSYRVGIFEDRLAELPEATDLVPGALPNGLGQMVFNEIHFSPAAGDGGAGQFVELYNRSDEPRRLGCCVLEADSQSHVIRPGEVVVPPHAYVALAGRADESLNGGIVGAYEWGDDLLLTAARGAQLSLRCPRGTSDAVDFAGGAWPAGSAGVSMQLSPEALHPLVNDEPRAWCDSTAAYGSGGSGSPGAANHSCAGVERVFSTGFDGEDGWTATGEWERHRHNPPEGIWGMMCQPGYCSGDAGHCLSAGVDGWNVYCTPDLDFADNYVQLGPIDLRAAGDAVLLFDLTLCIEDAQSPADAWFARAEIDVGEGAGFVPLDMTDPPYNHGSPPDAWAAPFMSSAWSTATAGLAPYVGRVVDLRFATTTPSSESCSWPMGMSVDNVEVYTFP